MVANKHLTLKKAALAIEKLLISNAIMLMVIENKNNYTRNPKPNGRSQNNNNNHIS